MTNQGKYFETPSEKVSFSIQGFIAMVIYFVYRYLAQGYTRGCEVKPVRKFDYYVIIST